ncbi:MULTISPECIES: M48 family metalloprotease [unclassified Gilliamella]|uniref:M48 family metalloprotease n=1 Tax=unclassified Gilliamella TaxID=2685620 RepID=UPI00132369AE|nr:MULTISPECIES: M48 family metalloprotease [unclassified Gilliamella]MWN32315.1 M48 family metalloprotease [Gilliamella sp. Pra-s60]MWP29527.1 M48 family metalloprotease [Gilliamella sp. Pra-s54]
MKRIILFLISCFLFCLLLSCQSSNKKPTFIITSEQIKHLSEQDIEAIGKQVCVESDKQSVVVNENSWLDKKLQMLAQTLPKKINNIELTYKVYLNTAPNAWSTANGCIRINSGLIKLLNDNELQAVLAHEQAHIALKHTIKSFRQAPYVEIANKDIFVLIKEDIAQQYEFDADYYAFDLLMRENINPIGLVTMLKKMQNHSTKKLITSHPPNISRINRILDRLGGK